jgi:hypothetical protein
MLGHIAPNGMFTNSSINIDFVLRNYILSSLLAVLFFSFTIKNR